MFPFLLIFIIFLVILTYYIKKSDSTQAKVQEEFLERERLANATRKQDISKLDYITIPLDLITQKLDTDAEKNLFELATKPMLNLTGISNTDLKLTYGQPNLALLSEYDTTFMEYITILPEYTIELQEAGFEDVACALLEHAISCNADSRKIYSQLATIYKKKDAVDKIQSLYSTTEALSPLTKKAIQKDLADYLP